MYAKWRTERTRWQGGMGDKRAGRKESVVLGIGAKLIGDRRSHEGISFVCLTKPGVASCNNITICSIRLPLGRYGEELRQIELQTPCLSKTCVVQVCVVERACRFDE